MDRGAGPRRARRLTRLLARAGLALAWLAAALALTELAVRWVAPQPHLSVTPGLTVADPPDGYRLRPGYRGIYTNRIEYSVTVEVNRFGLRGPAPRDGGDELRLLGLGDSFPFGTGVEEEEVFLERAAAELRSSAHPVIALNAGTPGFGPDDAVSWLERHGLELGPDLVILALFLGNDLQDAMSGSRSGRPLARNAPPRRTSRFKAWLDAHSHTVVLLKRAIPLPLQGRVLSWLGEPPPLELHHLRAEVELLLEVPPPWIERATEALAATLDRVAAPYRVPIAVVLIPSDLQLDPELLRSAASYLGLEASEFDPDRPRRLLRRLSRERALPCLDLTESFRRRYATGEPLYYRYDRHWTPAGHALAGRELAGFLAARELLGARPTFDRPRDQ